MRRLLDWLPFGTILAAIYPVVAILAVNIGQVRPTIAVRPLVISVASALVALLVINLVVRDVDKAGLLTTWAAVLFFAYGHAYNALRAIHVGETSPGRHRYLVPLWIILYGIGSWLILRRIGRVREWNARSAYVFLVALAIPVVQIGQAQLRAEPGFSMVGLGEAVPLDVDINQVRDQALPDIYYIILDAYARGDTLEIAFNYDNSQFLDSLEEMGFYVAECSQSNYAQTELSLASSLSSEYLSDLVEETLDEEVDRKELWPFIRHGAVRTSLEALGYQTVAFETGYYWSELEDADIYLAPVRGALTGMTAFEGTLLRSTAAWAALDASSLLSERLLPSIDRSTASHRQRIRFVLHELERMPNRPGTKFVFAHIVSPHRPFVFDAQGFPVNDDYDWSRGSIGLGPYVAGYQAQLTYLNGEVERVVSTILAESEPKPVVIIQGDHGPEESSREDRMRMLNAYYIPNEAGRDQLYSAISPVNSFRVVFNAVFGGSSPLLDDRSFFSGYQDPFNFAVIPNQCP